METDSPVAISEDDFLYPVLAEKLAPQPPPLTLAETAKDFAKSCLDCTTCDVKEVTHETYGTTISP